MLFYAPTMLIAPSAVKKHFGLSGQTPEENKTLVVLWCKSNLSPYNWRLIWAMGGSKVDDFAEVGLMCLYGGINHKKLLQEFRNPEAASVHAHRPKTIRRTKLTASGLHPEASVHMTKGKGKAKSKTKGKEGRHPRDVSATPTKKKNRSQR